MVAQHKELFNPNLHAVYHATAQMYVDKGQKLETAIKLLNEDLKSMRSETRMQVRVAVLNLDGSKLRRDRSPRLSRAS